MTTQQWPVAYQITLLKQKIAKLKAELKARATKSQPDERCTERRFLEDVSKLGRREA